MPEYAKAILYTISTAVALSVFLPCLVNCKAAPGAVERMNRQSPTTPPVMCGSQTDCLPSDVTGTVPSELVTCQGGGQCVCVDCFIRRADANQCYICGDFLYNSSILRCGADNRPGQTQAVLYSAFLSSVGAANFYVGRIGIGIGQVIVLVLFLLSLYVMICPCCVCCGLCDKEGAIKGTCIFILLFVVAIVAVVVTGLGIIIWWLTDLIHFVSNQVTTPAGCFLRPGL